MLTFNEQRRRPESKMHVLELPLTCFRYNQSNKITRHLNLKKGGSPLIISCTDTGQRVVSTALVTSSSQTCTNDHTRATKRTSHNNKDQKRCLKMGLGCRKDPNE